MKWTRLLALVLGVGVTGVVGWGQVGPGDVKPDVKVVPGGDGVAPTDEEKKTDEEHGEKEKKVDPADVRNAISNMSLVRDMKKLARPEKKGLWEQLVDQPYFTPEVRARKLLFHGQYDEAEQAYTRLLKGEPKNPEYLTGQLEAVLRRGREGDLARFVEKLGAAPAEVRESAKVVHLQAEARLEKGEVTAARELLAKYVERHAKLLPANGDLLAVYNLYGQVLESEAQYPGAMVVYEKLVDLAKEDLPDDAQVNTEITRAVHRDSVLGGKGKDVHRTVLAKLGQIVAKDGTYWPAHLLTAAVLLESHNLKEGGEALADTLNLNPNALEARFLAMDAAVENYQFEAARQQLEEIRGRTTSAEVAAHEGRLLLKERVPEKAIEPLKKAVAKNPRLAAARGWLAGAYYLLNDKAKMTEQLEAIKTPDGTLHPEVVFEAAEILRDARQFSEAEKLYQQVEKVAVWWSEPPAALAQLYMETGQEAKAKAAYDQSYAIDPFNMRAYNQLILLEMLQKFEVKESKARLKAGSNEPAFILRYEKQDEVLAGLAMEWLEKIRPELWSYFQITELPAPTQIEFFPSHEQFGVRTTGLPWIGTVGACTGNVIAMDVPRGGAKDMMGSFDWARVLRHEYTHTITLAMTNNRIPHWLTEAAACNQEQAPRDWGDTQLLGSNYRAGTLFKLADLNWGFIRPKKPNDRRIAYMQSQWIYEYLVGTYGQPKMLEFLRAFGEGATESQAWPRVYGKTMEEMDKEFLAWAGKQVVSWGFQSDPLPKRETLDAALVTNPKDVEAMYQWAWLLVSSGKAKEAQAQLEKAMEIDPKHTKSRELLGAILNQMKEPGKAKVLLEQVVQEDPTRPVALRTLGLIAMGEKNYDAAEKWFTKLQEIRPLEDTSYTNLAGIYLVRKQNAKAIGQLSELQRHEQKDERIPRKLAELYRAEGPLVEAEASAYRAIRINPYNAVNHEILAQVIMARKEPGRAVEYWRCATDLQPRVPEFWAGLAEAYGLSGDGAEAAKAAQKAVELQPTSGAKRWIK